MNKKTASLKTPTATILLKSVIIVALIEFIVMESFIIFEGYLSPLEEVFVNILLLSFLSVPLLYTFVINPFVQKEALSREKLSKMNEVFTNNVIASNSDLKGIITYASEALCTLSGYTQEELLGSPHSILRHPDTPQSTFEDMWKTIRSGEIWRGEYKNKIKQGGFYLVKATILPEFDNENNIVGYSSVRHDITNIKANELSLLKQKEKLYHQAHYDSLTNLPNRLQFNESLKQSIKEAKRDKMKLAVLSIDLDHFKEINDSLGHKIGDEILKKIAYRLQTVIREEDVIARLGGDEFSVILNELTCIEDASIITQKISDTLSQAISLEDTVLHISNSIGISIYPDDGSDPQSLIKFADSAMYKAKDEGRNNYQYYTSEMTELAFERVVMETALRAAIQKEEFTVHYQAQVNGKTDKLVGMEALVRWNHPSMGLISPAKFMPLAESTGLIVDIDRFVMKNAMTQLSHWYKEGLNPGVLAMNLTVAQLKQDDFIELLTSLLQETGCKPQWIELEVTESQVMTNPKEAIKVLDSIRKLGVKLAVDDFGTGYSSLAYLKKLPIDKLKIDQAFVKGLPDDEGDVGISQAIIALSKSLNLRVIAEGVETKEQKNFLIANGCLNIQGYFYAKPVEAKVFENILRDGFN